MKHFSLFILSLILLTNCKQPSNSATTSDNALPDSTIIATAKEAYVYGLSLVIMDISRRQGLDPSGNLYSPVNTFRHLSDFPDATFRDVVRPNADTYYSTALLDLTAEPVVLSVPDTKGRYYMIPMLDAYTNVFASPGSRTTGTKAGHFLITGPQWTGAVPADMKEIKSPTNAVWIIGRTQVNSKEDGEKVVIPLQKKYLLSPLSVFGKSYTPAAATADPNLPKGSPNDVVAKMSVEDYFNYVNQLLAKYPPPADNNDALQKFSTIGVKPGAAFNMASFDTATQHALKKVPTDVLKGIKEHAFNKAAGWNSMGDKVGKFGTDYTLRAFISYLGLGANLPEDAIYLTLTVDSDGQLLHGANQYTIHFDNGQTPPAKAFWSLTLYDAEGYFVPNDINRYAVGDRSNLKKNADGSIDIYMQHASPGKEKESNWLPTPDGDFNLLMRVYWPKDEMINGTWKPALVKKVKG